MGHVRSEFELAQIGDTLGILFIAPAVNLIDLLHPASSVQVLQLQELGHGPVEVIGEVGYLLMELVEGVAGYPPTSLILTSTSVPQFGQVARATAAPSALIWR